MRDLENILCIVCNRDADLLRCGWCARWYSKEWLCTMGLLAHRTMFSPGENGLNAGVSRADGRYIGFQEGQSANWWTLSLSRTIWNKCEWSEESCRIPTIKDYGFYWASIWLHWLISSVIFTIVFVVKWKLIISLTVTTCFWRFSQNTCME